MRVPLPALILACVAAIGGCRSAAAQDQVPADVSPLQVIADITLIDSHCRGVTVYYNALFRYGADHDIPSPAIMPLGTRRKALEAAMAWRLAGTSSNELCTAVVDQADAAAPGIMKRP